MARRRLRVRGADQHLVLGLGAATGAGLALRGLEPTGSTVVDWMLLVVAGAAAVWACASAPWWALSGVAAIATAIADPWLPLLIGAGVFALSLGVGVMRRSQPVERAAVAGAAILVLSLARELGWFGLNSLVAIVLVAAVAATGLLRRSRRERRLAIYVVSAVASVVALGVLGLLAAAASARPDLSEGNRSARQGLRLLKSGEFEQARVSFERAAAAFERADDDLGAPWAQAARLVPIANQHRDAAASLSSAAATAARTIHGELRMIDLDSLGIVDSRIDVAAVRALQPPLLEVRRTLDDLERTVGSARSEWLVTSIREELDELQVDIDEQQELGERALAALDVAPAILGADGERVYFVMFTTPAEARGQGGFMGNYAELTVNDGMIEMTAFGRHRDLNRAGERPRTLVDAPEDWLARYGQYGFQKGADGVVGRVPWSNITISPDFPATAQVVAELYPQSGGREIDGVISLDVFAIEALIGEVGPIDVEGSSEPLTGENAAQFLLLDQYDLAQQGERVDLLETVARVVVDRMLTTSPPDPLELGRAMAPAIGQRRLTAWSAVDAEQTVISMAGMDGALLGDVVPGDDALAVFVSNGGASKIDTFLDRDFHYELDVGADGSIAGTLDLRFTNDAPPIGYPDYVIGNAVGLPSGTSRLIATVVTPLDLCRAEIDGRPRSVNAWRDDRLWSYTVTIDIPPGETTVLRLDLRGVVGLPDGRYHLHVQHQPLARAEVWSFGGLVTMEPRPHQERVHIVSEVEPGSDTTAGC